MTDMAIADPWDGCQYCGWIFGHVIGCPGGRSERRLSPMVRCGHCGRLVRLAWYANDDHPVCGDCLRGYRMCAHGYMRTACQSCEEAKPARHDDVPTDDGPVRPPHGTEGST